MDTENVTTFLEEMIDVLTIRRVALLTIFFAASVGLLTAFENRASIFASLYTATANTQSFIQWDMSAASKNQLVSLSRQPLIGAVWLWDVDLKKNRRINKYSFAQDPQLAAEMSSTFASLLPQALFDFDQNNTDQMVSMLSNEFACAETTNTDASRLFPKISKPLPYLCRIAVPPFFGEFAGYITIFLVRQPRPEEFDALKIELSRVAIEIYLRDIAKKPA